MHLTQDNDVVHALTPDRSDQPFKRATCGAFRIADCYRSRSSLSRKAAAPSLRRTVGIKSCGRTVTFSPAKLGAPKAFSLTVQTSIPTLRRRKRK
jgi:hypothetical protein